LMAVWGQGEPDSESSRKRRAKGVSAIVLARDRWLGANVNVRALQAAQPWARNSAADEPASRHVYIRAAHSHINAEQLASAAPSHSASADKHPRTPTGGREAGAEGSMGRTGGWGGREYGADSEGSRPGAEGSMGRKGGWGGREYGAEGSMGGKGVWGGGEYGAEGSMGRKGVWGARHIPTHHPPLAPSSYDINSQPAGRHLPYLVYKFILLIEFDFVLTFL
jgi:hypothetical protein